MLLSKVENILRGSLDLIPSPKEIGDKEPYYSTKISYFSFIWAGPQCGGLSMRCHRVTVYRDIKI